MTFFFTFSLCKHIDKAFLLTHISLPAMSGSTSTNINHLLAGLSAGNKKPRTIVEVEIPRYQTTVRNKDEEIEDKEEDTDNGAVATDDDDGDYFYYDDEEEEEEEW